MEFCIVIPAWNESAYIVKSVSAAKYAMEQQHYSGRLVVVDNNSSDDTAKKAAGAGAEVVFEPVNQIARARNTGALATETDWLVVRQSNYYGFRAAEPVQGKTLLAGNGCSIVKSCNAAMERLCDSLRARLPAPADCVALPRRSTTMPSKERLAANADSHAEPAIIRLTDHLYSSMLIPSSVLSC